MELVNLTNVKTEEFEKVFREYFIEEGINLRPDTTVFDEMQKGIEEHGVKILTIRKDDKLIAFIMYQIIKMTALDEFFKQKLGFIREFYVIPSERGNGYSKVLTQNVEEYFKRHEVDRIILNAEEEVYEFYFKQGYYIDETYKSANNLRCLFKDLI